MDFASSGQPLSSPKVAHLEVRQALDVLVGGHLEKVLPVLAAVYLWMSSLTIFQGPNGSGGNSYWFGYTTGAAALALWSLLRRGRIAPGRVHLHGWLVTGLVLIGTLVEFSRTGSVNQVGMVAFLLICSGSILLDWRGFALTAAVSVGGWLVLAQQKLPMPSQLICAAVLLSALLISALIMHRRLTKNYRTQELLLSEEARKIEKERKRALNEKAVQATEDGLWYWDIESGAFEVSASWATLLGYEKEELGTTVDEWFDRVHPGYLSELKAKISTHIEGHSGSLHYSHRLLRKDGSYVWVLARGAVVRNERGEAVALTGSHSDVSLLIETEKLMVEDSFKDKLTGLPNRDFLIGALRRRVEESNKKRNRAPRFALLFLDLDRFKVINDSLGHTAGDQLLVAVASRLRSCARPKDVIARFGGDEFVILLEPIQHADEAESMGNRIKDALCAPFHLNGRDVVAGASVGVAIGGTEIDNVDDLLRYADIAMYRAKVKGKGQVQLFNEGLRSYATKLCDLQNDLGQALSRKQLRLHYQPHFSVSTGKIIGVEALIRWQRSESELMMPADFVPIAEEIGLISEIGEWAMRSACAQNAAWQKAGIDPVRMAVNISARQLQEKEFPRQVLSILDEAGLPAQWLDLELTETALINSLDAAPGALDYLRSFGVRAAIDDFGTGYSSVNYLRQFNFHTLKMDRCFVSDVTTNAKTAAIAKGVILLAHNLDLKVIAEGVENDAQLAFLAAEGCDQAQGFLAGKPVSAEQLTDLLRLGDVRKLCAHNAFEPSADLSRLASFAHDPVARPASPSHLIEYAC